jgi:hypothetical protein
MKDEDGGSPLSLGSSSIEPLYQVIVRLIFIRRAM